MNGSTVTGKEAITSVLVSRFLSEKRLAKTTREMYNNYLKWFIRTMPEDINAIGLESLEANLMSYSQTHSPSSYSTYAYIIKSFYGWLSEFGYRNIAHKIICRDFVRNEQRVLSAEEYKKIVYCPIKQQYKDTIVFLCNTGLRASEFSSLQKENVSSGFVRVVGKRGKYRAVPLNHSAKDALSRNPNLEFVRPVSTLRYICKQVAKSAGIPAFHCHSCRHYLATELYHKGVPLATISKLLGHANSVITERVYISWKESNLAGTTDILD